MNTHRTTRAVAAMLALAMLATTVMAPLAEAGHGNGRGRHKHRGRDREVRVVERHHAPRRVVEYRRRSDGSALAGFIGGLAVGALLTHAAKSSHARPAYTYEDPYCHDRFASLDACGSSMRSCDHPRVVRVIEVSSGRCVDTYRWQRNAGWVECGSDWQNAGYDDRSWERDRGWEDEE